MTDELNKQKAFLKWQESAVVLQSDAKQSIDRAQGLLSMRSLDELYKNGSGITPDITIGSHWYGLAVGQGNPIAKKHLQRLAQSNTLL
jgi:TPR repeat protein